MPLVFDLVEAASPEEGHIDYSCVAPQSRTKWLFAMFDLRRMSAAAVDMERIMWRSFQSHTRCYWRSGYWRFLQRAPWRSGRTGGTVALQ
jgi:hypothetical protein